MLSDQRLLTPVALAWADRPLGEVLPELGKTLGVALSADRSVADDQVTFLCKERPAKELLPLVAEHFGFHWRRQGEGYELWQDLAGRQREAALRQAEVDGILAQINACFAEAGELSKHPMSERATRFRELRAALEQTALAGEERERIRWQLLALAASADESYLPEADALRSLIPDQLRTLRTFGQVSLSSEDGTLSEAVTKQILQNLRRTKPEAKFAAATVTFRITDRVGEPMPDPHFSNSVVVRPRLEYLASIRYGPAAGVATNGHDSALMTVLETFPTPSVTPPDDTELLQEVELIPRSNRRFLPLAQVAQRLHEVTGMPILVDSFIRARVWDEALVGKKPLYQLLHSLEQNLDYRCQMKEGVLSLRSVRFFRDRPREVPSRLRAPWREQMEKQGSLTLDGAARMAATLSDEQLRALSSYWYWQFERDGDIPRVGPPNDLVLRRSDLRLWDALNPAQRATAQKKGVPIRTLNGIQQRLLLAAYSTRGRSHRQDLPATLPPPELLSGVFSVTHQQGRAYQHAVRNADGSDAGSGSSQGAPDRPAPPPPTVEEGQRLVRTTALVDWFQFRYTLPRDSQFPRSSAIQLPHASEVLK
jgi:hypothetical protein